jgi:hypothetical protein
MVRKLCQDVCVRLPELAVWLWKKLMNPRLTVPS